MYLFEGLSIDRGQTSSEDISRQIECWVLQMEKRKFQKHNLMTVDEQREGSGKWRMIPWVTECK